MEAAGEMIMEDSWQSKGMLSTDKLLAAKVPVLDVGGAGCGGTGAANCGGQLQGEQAARPAPCGAELWPWQLHPCGSVLLGCVWARGRFSGFCVHAQSMMWMSLKTPPFLHNGVCQNKHSSVIFFCFAFKKKHPPQRQQQQQNQTKTTRKPTTKNTVSTIF